MDIEIVDNKKFSEILVEGETWKEVHRQLYKRYLKEILRCQTKKELSDCTLKIDEKIARGIVYKALALKGYMKSELEKKLVAFKIDSRAIASILEECERLGYVNDQREGKLYIQREKRRGLGPQMIAYKLQQKLPELKEMVREEMSEEEQTALIKKWVTKKTARADLNEIKVKERLYRFLRAKGFDDHLIRQELFT